jgi:hypothetical protein
MNDESRAELDKQRDFNERVSGALHALVLRLGEIDKRQEELAEQNGMIFGLLGKIEEATRQFELSKGGIYKPK